MRLMIVLLVLLPGKLFAVSALAPEHVLLRMQRAVLQQSFQGSFSYQHGEDFFSYRIWHQAADNEEGRGRERLLRLDGAVQELLREDDKTLCASSRLQQALPLNAYIQQTLNLEKLQSGYVIGFAESSRARVAGRKTWVLSFMPRDKNRHAMELHVDIKTYIPLKATLLNERGQVLENVQFLSFTEDAPTAQDLTPSSACLPVTQSAPASVEFEANPWQLSHLPSGFYLQGIEHSEKPLVDGWQTHLIYTDGLARFSVFLEPLQGDRREISPHQFGSTTVVSRNRHFAGADWMVTVVGEIPSTTAGFIALSIDYAAPASP